MNCEPGDWISWLRDNRLVLGRVVYVRIPSYGSYKAAYTDNGMVRLDEIIEVRKQEPSA